MFADIITWLVQEETVFNVEWFRSTKMFSDEKCASVSATKVGKILLEHHAIVIVGLDGVAQAGRIDIIERVQ